MRKKPLELEELRKDINELKNEEWIPEFTTTTCATCINTVVIPKKYESKIKEIGISCGNCSRLAKFKDDIITVFKDKEFVQCLKELMKEK